MNGYYTTSGISEKNNFLISENIKNDENILKIGNYSSCPAENIHKEEFLKGFIDISKDNNTPFINNSNVRMSIRVGFKEKKINCYKFNDYFNVYIEKIIFFRDDVMKKKKVDINNEQFKKCETIREKYKRKERIIEQKKLIEYYKNKREITRYNFK